MISQSATATFKFNIERDIVNLRGIPGNDFTHLWKMFFVLPWAAFVIVPAISNAVPGRFTM